MTMRIAALLLLAVALPVAALEEVTWPPAGDAAVRMRELQQAIVSRDSTPAQRDAAREELGRMLMRDQRAVPEASRKPRAAVDPFPSVVTPTNIAPPPAPPPAAGVARVEVLEPSRPAINPRTGSIAAPISPATSAPAPGFAVDPRTGTVLHPTGNGYVDPRTGQFTPR